MKLSLRRVGLLEANGSIWIRCRRQDKGRSWLELVLQRRLFGGAAGQRRAVRAGRVDGLKLFIESQHRMLLWQVRGWLQVANITVSGQVTYIVLGEQMERAEDLVVFEIERPRSLKVPLEGSDIWGFYDKLLWGSQLAELLLMRRRDSGCSPRSAAVVVVGGVRIQMGGMVLTAIAEELRHDYWEVEWMSMSVSGWVVGDGG